MARVPLRERAALAARVNAMLLILRKNIPFAPRKIDAIVTHLGVKPSENDLTFQR
jgi:hypothetical protein